MSVAACHSRLTGFAMLADLTLKVVHEFLFGSRLRLLFWFGVRWMGIPTVTADRWSSSAVVAEITVLLFEVFWLVRHSRCWV